MVTRIYVVLISGLRQLGLADFRFGSASSRATRCRVGPGTTRRTSRSLALGRVPSRDQGPAHPPPTRGAPRLEAGWVVVFAAPTHAPLEDLAADLVPALRDGASLVLLQREM
jgi:hypothetical protein